MITIMDESQILNEDFRKEAIETINSASNRARKHKALKAYEIYKDLTKKWVVDAISKEFSAETVEQMVARASNISLCKKIINKKAKCYAGGVERELQEEKENTEKLDKLSILLQSNMLMKQADRFSELLKNCEIQVLYENDAVEKDGDGKAKKKPVNRIMLPFQYDPICHAHDNKKPIAFVLSDFCDSSSMISANPLLSDYDGNRDQNQIQVDKLKNKSAKASAPKKATFYIWWSTNFHFTTDEHGKMVGGLSPLPTGDITQQLNPIKKLNFVSVHGDQENGYWCDGGDDLIDGSVLVNVLLTDMFAIMNVQGWGQMVVKGKKVPSKITGGPHKAIVFEFDSGDPEPSVDYVSSNPPIEQWRESITMYVALILSTNNLSTKNVSTELNGTDSISGVAKMIDESESTEGVEDKQEMFKGVEAKLWDVNFETQNYLFEQGSLSSDFQEIGEVRTAKKVRLKFKQQKPIMSEVEKVEILQKKKETGLYKIVDLLRIEDTGLSLEDAEKKAEELLADRMKFAALYANALQKAVGDANEELANSGNPPKIEENKE